ncbi:MAG TPA: TetR/AcrR family transcriptional regulator [Pyrinomonadaceae bacterium]|jgi:AcrR family transcriptional regulator|nr:TetR/AcrR family transcriptional regulator [Pyrinomonadaceae bacterium]
MRNIAVREDIRDMILEAADRLLARYGYRKMTMEDVAQEVGIGKGTIYLHFSSKEELALSHIDRIVEHLQERLRAIARSDASVAVRLRLMLLARVLYRFDSVQHYTQSINDVLSALRPALLARREHYFAEEARIFAEVLAEGKKEGTFACADVNATANTLLLATNSLLPYSLSTRELGEREDIKEKATRIADLLLVGLLRRERKPDVRLKLATETRRRTDKK